MLLLLGASLSSSVTVLASDTAETGATSSVVNKASYQEVIEPQTNVVQAVDQQSATNSTGTSADQTSQQKIRAPAATHQDWGSQFITKS